MLRIDFKTVVENSPEAIAIFDRTGTLIYLNKALADLTGFSAAEMMSGNIFKILPGDSHNLVKSRLLLPAMGEGVQYRYVLEVLTKSEARIPCDIVTSTLNTNDGKELVMAFVRDMTGMKVLEGRFSAEHNKYLDLVSESTSMVLVLSKDLVISLANRGFRERLKYPEDSVVGKNIRDLRIMDSTIIEAVQSIASSNGSEGRRGMESSAWTNDGLKMIISWYLSPVKEMDGSVSGVLAIGHDITSKFQLESLYHSTSKMLEIEHSISHLTSTAVDSRLMMENALDLILRMYGHEEGFAMDLGSIVDCSLLAIIGDKLEHDKINGWISDKIEDFYEPAYLPDDEVMTGLEPFINGLNSVALLPLRGKGGVIGYICIGSENQILLSQNEKDAMVGVISMLGFAYENIGLAESLRKSKEQLSLYNDILLHDITNYLVPLKVYLDLLKKTDCGNGKRHEYLDRVTTSDEALNEFVSDVKLLMYAKNSKTDILTAIPLLDELRNAIDVSISRFGGAVVELIVLDEDKMVNVMADKALYHLFTNLITNAIKHSAPRPVVVRVLMNEDGGRVNVSVEDEGPGIPDDKKGLVFDRGFSEPTGKVAKSTGIGLSIVSALVQKYNGKVRVKDRVPMNPSFGACFVVELKLAGS